MARRRTRRLVDACHARGLAVLLDVVYNHLGPSGNYLGKFAPYFTEKFATTWGEAVNFDGAESGEVRRYFCDNARMWLRDFISTACGWMPSWDSGHFGRRIFSNSLKCEVADLRRKWAATWC